MFSDNKNLIITGDNRINVKISTIPFLFGNTVNTTADLCLDFYCKNDKVIDYLLSEDKIIISTVRLYDGRSNIMVLRTNRSNVLYMSHAIFLSYKINDTELELINRLPHNKDIKAEFYNMDNVNGKAIFDIDVFFK